MGYWEKAGELQADLIIVAADIDTVVQDFFVGPYAQQIVNHANVPVLSIRPRPLLTPRRQPMRQQQAHEPASFPEGFPSIQFG